MDAKRVRRLMDESSEVIAGLKGQAGAVKAAGDALVKALEAGKTLFSAGNGGSAAEAMHFAEELTGRFRTNRAPLPGVALVADCTALTCIGNDFGFDRVFSRQVEALGRPGDCLVLFSTSGNSPNLIRAVESARKKRMVTIGLLGKTGGEMAGKTDHTIIVGSKSTGRIQEAHQLILHILLEIIEEKFAQQA